MKNTIYISFGSYPSHPALALHLDRLRVVSVDAALMKIADDVWGWPVASPQMPVDGIVIIHLLSERIRYELLDVPDRKTRQPGVPVLFIGQCDADHSKTIIAVRNDLFQSVWSSGTGMIFDLIMEFCNH